MAGSTETEQFHGEGHVAPMVPQMAQQQAARMVPVAQEQDNHEHDHDDGLVHGHGWAATTPQPMEAADAHHDHDDGLVHGHNWAWSD